MTDYEKLLEIQRCKLQKALIHLEYSHQKILKLSTNPEQLDEESLEGWESFSAATESLFL